MPDIEYGKGANMKKHKKMTWSRKAFLIFDVFIILGITLSCIVPVINLFAFSFSSSSAIMSNRVTLFPVEFTTKAYEYVMSSREFWTSVLVSLKRVALGVPINLILTIMVAYPLSKPDETFRSRKYYVAYMLIVMLFNGGLMPTYYIISKTRLIDTIWSLVLPGAVPVFNCIVLMNFFRGIPADLEESAKLDGAGQWKIMRAIYVPLSKPAIATVTLFCLVGHWNSWFDGLIYSNYTYNYPLQSYLQTIVTSTTEMLKSSDLKSIMALTGVNDTNLKSAQIFIAIIPLMAVYPFLQKYFTTGLTLGSVKG